jgi:hypothetical protein
MLRDGAILASLAHACFVMAKPILSNEQYWDGNDYCVEDSAGSFGTVTFLGDDMVGVFFSANSGNNPLKSDQDYDLNRYLAGMSANYRQIAQDGALKFMLQDYRGSEVPVVTASLWGNSEKMFGSGTWQELLSNGAHLIRRQVLRPEQAITEWKAYYDLSPPQVALVTDLFARRTAAASLPITLTDHDREVLMQSGTAGVAQVRELLAAIQIQWGSSA